MGPVMSKNISPADWTACVPRATKVFRAPVGHAHPFFKIPARVNPDAGHGLGAPFPNLLWADVLVKSRHVYRMPGKSSCLPRRRSACYDVPRSALLRGDRDMGQVTPANRKVLARKLIWALAWGVVGVLLARLTGRNARVDVTFLIIGVIFGLVFAGGRGQGSWLGKSRRDVHWVVCRFGVFTCLSVSSP